MNRNEMLIKILEEVLEKAKAGNLYLEALDSRVVGSLMLGDYIKEPTLLEVTLRYWERIV